MIDLSTAPIGALVIIGLLLIAPALALIGLCLYMLLLVFLFIVLPIAGLISPSRA